MAGVATILREPCDAEELILCLRDARARSLALIEDLSDEQWLGPELASVNPPLWEIGHVAWFEERWTLRQLARCPPLRADADELYDSSAVAHAARWRLALPRRAATLEYVAGVLEEVERRLRRGALDAQELYFHRLALYHEDMHGEAFVLLRQILGYPAPPPCAQDALDTRAAAATLGGGPCPGDVEVPGGTWPLGARPGAAFAFDNEQWSHEVELAPFRIARAPVTQAEFRVFVEDEGYRRAELWSETGRAWLAQTRATHPVYWKRAEDGRGGERGWLRRSFDRWLPLEEHLPVHHVNAHEAEAFCRWAGRRLPSEAEWECAAGSTRFPARFPWGSGAPTAELAELDLRSAGPCDVGAHPGGDSPHGLRQMIGNVWEWTASSFEPYPGFEPGPYADYSAPWFGTHRVLRGGAFATRARLLRNTWRNFYTPDRRDALAGFRTSAP